MSVRTLNRLQKFIKNNDISMMSGEVPVSLGFFTNGDVVVKHTGPYLKRFNTIKEACDYIDSYLKNRG